MAGSYQALGQGYSGAASASGFDKGAREVSTHFSPESTATRQNARALKAERDKQLSAIKNTEYTQEDFTNMSETQSQELENQKLQSQATHSSLVQSKAFDSFRRFEADGNIKHMNQALADLTKPDGTRIVPDVIRFDEVTEVYADELEKAYGISYDQYKNTPELKNFFMSATMADGTTKLIPTQSLLAGTGYDNYKLDSDLERQSTQADIFYKTQSRYAAATSSKERHAKAKTDTLRQDDPEWKEGNPEYDLAYVENLDKLGEKTENLTQDEAEAKRRADALEPEGAENWGPGNDEYDTAYNQQFDSIVQRDRETAGQKNQGAVRGAKQTIRDRAVASGENFFDIDFGNDFSKRIEYEEDIQEIMQLGGVELSAAERKDATYIHELMDLGESTSKELGTEETGIMDRLLMDVSRYVSDNVEGVAAVSTYAAYRNTVRHALFGSVLSDGEIKAFNEQMGNLGQQEGPVLAQFRTGLVQVKSQLESMMNLGDSYVSHFYLGANQNKLIRMVDALDERLALIDKRQASAEPEEVQSRIQQLDSNQRNDFYNLETPEDRKKYLDEAVKPSGGRIQEIQNNIPYASQTPEQQQQGLTDLYNEVMQ